MKVTCPWGFETGPTNRSVQQEKMARNFGFRKQRDNALSM